MHYYLTPFRGRGADRDPYRPVGADEHAVWHMLELHRGNPDTSVRALLATPDRLDLPGQTYLGDDLDAASAVIKTAIGSRLSMTLEATTLRGIVPELFLAHADGVRIPRLRPYKGVYEIWLGDRIFQMRVPSGGAASLSETFPGDSGTPGGDIAWTVDEGDFDNVGGQGKSITNDVLHTMRADTTIDSADQYVYMQVVDLGESSVGVIFRKTASATLTYYRVRYITSNNIQLHKVIAASATLLSGPSYTPSLTEEIKGQAQGTTIKGISGSTAGVGGTEQISVTNGDIDGSTVGGLAVGVSAFDRNALFDNWGAVDLNAGGDPEGPLVGGKLIRGGLLVGGRLVR